MKLVDFNDDLPTYDDIKEYYDSTYESIENYFSRTHNPQYDVCFENMTDAEIDEMEISRKTELSIEAGFALLAYIESLFRTDFILRIESRKYGDQLSAYYRTEYNPAQRLYMFGLEKIFEGWKNHYGNVSKHMVDILNTLPQYYDYRNWIAHGRYWTYKETNYLKKYQFDHLQMLYEEIVREFGGKFKKKNFGLNA